MGDDASAVRTIPIELKGPAIQRENERMSGASFAELFLDRICPSGNVGKTLVTLKLQ